MVSSIHHYHRQTWKGEKRGKKYNFLRHLSLIRLLPSRAAVVVVVVVVVAIQLSFREEEGTKPCVVKLKQLESILHFFNYQQTTGHWAHAHTNCPRQVNVNCPRFSILFSLNLLRQQLFSKLNHILCCVIVRRPLLHKKNSAASSFPFFHSEPLPIVWWSSTTTTFN